MDYGNTKRPSIHFNQLWLGIVTLLHLAFLGESDPNFPWDKFQLAQQHVKKKRLHVKALFTKHYHAISVHVQGFKTHGVIGTMLCQRRPENDENLMTDSRRGRLVGSVVTRSSVFFHPFSCHRINNMCANPRRPTKIILEFAPITEHDLYSLMCTTKLT